MAIFAAAPFLGLRKWISGEDDSQDGKPLTRLAEKMELAVPGLANQR
jgi:hypothetical protein